MPQEIKIGDKVKHSDRYIRMMRGHHQEKAKKALYVVTYVNDLSVRVVPHGSDQKFGTQYARAYIIPAGEEVKTQMMCRYCRKPTSADMPDVIPDYDNVTNELIGFVHPGCMPDDVPV